MLPERRPEAQELTPELIDKRFETSKPPVSKIRTAGLLAPGSIATARLPDWATLADRINQWPASPVSRPVRERPVPGHSGGGRAGISPASLHSSVSATLRLRHDAVNRRAVEKVAMTGRANPDVFEKVGVRIPIGDEARTSSGLATSGSAI